MFNKMKRMESIIAWLTKKSWFFSAFLFLGLIVSGNIDSEKDFFAILMLCLSLWILDTLFLKKGITILLNKVLNLYKRWAHEFDKKR
jgi:hypothetical protein